MFDYDTIKVDQFKGIFKNYDTESIPPGHFKDALNYSFLANGPCKIRNGTDLLFHIGSESGPDIRRVKRFEIPGQADHIMALANDGGLYDLSVSTTVPIDTTLTLKDFCGVSLYGRFYYSFSNSLEGEQDGVIRVYDPSATPKVRDAAGEAPSGDITLVGTSLTAQAVATVATAQAFTDGVALTLTASPYVPINPNTIKITLTKGTSTITGMTITVVGKDAGGDAKTKDYVNKVLSAGPLTFTTFEEWSSITSITPHGITGTIGTGKLTVQTTGKPPGKVERGYHIIAFSYETNSGFITPPGPASGSGSTINVNYLVFLVTRARKVLQITGLPGTDIIPAGVKKIHILASKSIVKARYSGNPNDYELFYVPKTSGGEVALGTTTATINFFDADLVDSADSLKDNLARLPAGVAMLATSTGRLLVTGVNSTSSVVPSDPNDPANKPGNNTVIWASSGGEPEAISATDGFVIIKPGGEGIRNLAEYRGLIYAFKPARTYATQDSGDLPSTWQVDSIDNSAGAECHSVSIALGSDASSNDQIIVGARSGLELFTGSYAERNLSWKIKEIWDSIDDPTFQDTEIAVDPTNNIIYVTCRISPLATYPDTILVGDYNEGLDWQNIKWSRWNLRQGAASAISFFTHITTNGVELVIGCELGDVIRYIYGSADIADDGVEIDNLIELYRMRNDDAGGVSQVVGYRARVLGNGTLNTTFYGPEDATSITPTTVALTTGVTNNIWVPTNLVADSYALKMVLTGTNRALLISYIWIYGTALWASRPA